LEKNTDWQDKGFDNRVSLFSKVTFIKIIIFSQVAGQCKNDCPGTNGDRHCHREPMKNQIV
jgi:hypothetical protein